MNIEKAILKDCWRSMSCETGTKKCIGNKCMAWEPESKWVEDTKVLAGDPDRTSYEDIRKLCPKGWVFKEFKPDNHVKGTYMFSGSGTLVFKKMVEDTENGFCSALPPTVFEGT